jgi:hypothetical protein
MSRTRSTRYRRRLLDRVHTGQTDISQYKTDISQYKTDISQTDGPGVPRVCGPLSDTPFAPELPL